MQKVYQTDSKEFSQHHWTSFVPFPFHRKNLGRTEAHSPISRSQVDADHTGTITLDELKAYFDRVGIQHDDLAKTFQALDVDKDGDFLGCCIIPG